METKNCAECGGRRPVGEFYRRANGYLSDLCKPHFLERRKAYTKKYRAGPAKDRLAEMQEVLKAYKDRPCADCGRSFPSYCMDLDHRDPNTKTKSSGDLVRTTATAESLVRELGLCDVVCAVCHRIRTHEKDHYRLRPKRTYQRRSRSLLRTKSSGNPPSSRPHR